MSWDWTTLLAVDSVALVVAAAAVLIFGLRGLRR